jgi:hypothetical protein
VSGPPSSIHRFAEALAQLEDKATVARACEVCGLSIQRGWQMMAQLKRELGPERCK